MVVADYDADRARYVVDATNHGGRYIARRIDASSADTIAAAARDYEVDLVMNAIDPQFMRPIMHGALAAGVDYMDMTMSLSRPHAERPLEAPGVKLGDEQFAKAAECEAAGRLPLVGMAMDSGLSDFLTAYAAKHLFDEGGVDEVHVRDAATWRSPASLSRRSSRSHFRPI